MVLDELCRSGPPFEEEHPSADAIDPIYRFSDATLPQPLTPSRRWKSRPWYNWGAEPLTNSIVTSIAIEQRAAASPPVVDEYGSPVPQVPVRCG